MRVVIVNTDYEPFLSDLYSEHAGLEHCSYAEQLRVRHARRFGVADFFSSNLRKSGHEAWDIYANNEILQRTWAEENGVAARTAPAQSDSWRTYVHRLRRGVARTPLRYLKSLVSPLVRVLDSHPSWMCDILLAQIKGYKPDVLLNQAMDCISPRLMDDLKPHVRLLVGQIASPIPSGTRFDVYDLVLSSLPNYVEHFRRLGMRSELMMFAFETALLTDLQPGEDLIPISFVGSMSPIHKNRLQLLEHLSGHLDLSVWGHGFETLPRGSSVRRRYRGRAWGNEMYRILHRSRMTVNAHEANAGSYANNMRLFEATGVGTLLLTDWKLNLKDMFEPGREVVTFRTAEECVELAQYYLEHDSEREAIAQAGQRRTLQDHSYQVRTQEFTEIIQRCL